MCKSKYKAKFQGQAKCNESISVIVDPKASFRVLHSVSKYNSNTAEKIVRGLKSPIVNSVLRPAILIDSLTDIHMELSQGSPLNLRWHSAKSVFVIHKTMSLE